MSNPSTPAGYQEAGLLDGISPNSGVTTVNIDPTNSHSIYAGDVAGVISGGYYDVATAVGGGAPIGGIFGDTFSWQSKSAGKTVYTRAWLGQTSDVVSGGTVTAKLYRNSQNVFKVRSSGTNITAAQVGSNANFVAGATPGNNLVSTMALDASTIGAGGSLPFRIVSIIQQPESDPTATYNEVIVKFNNLG